MPKVRYQKLRQQDVCAAQQPPDEKKSNKWLVLWRIINAFMTIFFILSTYVQINDPDPYVWIPIYAVPTLLCAALAFKPSFTESLWWRLTCWGHMALCMAGSVYLVASVVEQTSADMSNPLVFEEGRELFGLIITIIWLAICSFSSFSSTNSPKQTTSFLMVMTALFGIIPLVLWGVCFIEGLGPQLSYCSEVCGTKKMLP